MKKAFVFLAEGFEETEALGTVDVLRRAGIEATTVSINNEKCVKGAHNIPVMADICFNEASFDGADALILPGGMPGSKNLNECEPLKEALLQQFRENRIVAAICAAPLVLGGLGLLKGTSCYRRKCDNRKRSGLRIQLCSGSGSCNQRRSCCRRSGSRIAYLRDKLSDKQY